LTVAAVPTGMKAGVRISPRSIAMLPVRAAPLVAAIENEKRVKGAASHHERVFADRRLDRVSLIRELVLSPSLYSRGNDRPFRRLVEEYCRPISICDSVNWIIKRPTIDAKCIGKTLETQVQFCAAATAEVHDDFLATSCGSKRVAVGITRKHLE
jgi:hypothetical protein